jgi:hypothetical protein
MRGSNPRDDLSARCFLLCHFLKFQENSVTELFLPTANFLENVVVVFQCHHMSVMDFMVSLLIVAEV